MIAAIIQARMSSTRFPGKCLADICGKPMLMRVVDRVYMAGIEPIITTSKEPENRNICMMALTYSWKLFIGSELDVLDRYYQTATLYEIDPIIRVTSDCPLIDPNIIRQALNYFINEDVDLVTTVGTYPDGLDVEVMSYDALEQAWIHATEESDREHVTPYIERNLRVKVLPGNPELSKHQWSVDYHEDLVFVRKVYEMWGDRFHLEQILEMLSPPVIGGSK